MMLKSKDRPTPAPTYMSDDQKAQYLHNLRTSALCRPSGSRPLPPSKYTNARRTEKSNDGATTARSGSQSVLPTSKSMPIMPVQPSLHPHLSSSNAAEPTNVDEAIAPHADMPDPNATGSALGDMNTFVLSRKPDVPYLERGTRWMEKQEVASVSRALHDMDLETEEEEKRIHASAQDEAAELVHRHQNPEATNAPYANPDLQRDYHSHLRKGSYARSHAGQDVLSMLSNLRKSSGGSHESSNVSQTSLISNKRRSMDILRKVSPPSGEVTVQKRRVSSNGKSYGALADQVADDIAQAHQRTSSGSRRIFSVEKKRAYMHPDDRIWEDPQEDAPSTTQRAAVQQRPPVPTDTAAAAVTQQPVIPVRKNPFARVRMQADKLERSRSEPIVSITSSTSTGGTSLHDRVEIQRNPPSQSRNPWYTSNVPLSPTPTPPPESSADEVASKVNPDGKEVRSDDIRAATSKQRKDYSPKLPRPTAVSDKPGRPIISFDRDWKARELVLDEFESQAASSREPKKTRHSNNNATIDTTSSRERYGTVVDAPVQIPTFTFTDETSIPSIVLPSDDEDFARPSHATSSPPTPIISVDCPEISVHPPTIRFNDTTSPARERTMRQVPATSARPAPTHAFSSPFPMARPHYTPQSSALCAACALPIAGRALSASGARFHPACFTCHACHTNLELVAFYAEPEKAHSERVERIHARAAGQFIPGEEHHSQHEIMQQELLDGHDEQTPRFYCHLDYHEYFSPRCKSCKTPIEGEVIVACGAEWHVGHFFCAQCGDPFDSSMPFVEKEGYAWCVGCHTNRFSPKCRGCRKPVVDMVVKAMGAEWHAECFCCVECGDEFRDGRYFLRGSSEDPVCVGCEERRLKS